MGGDRGQVKLDVFQSRPRPGYVFLHRVLDEPRPHRRMAERLRRANHRGEELPGVVGPESESVAFLRRGIVVADRIREAARRPHHGDRAIAKCDELRKAARLEARRHPQHVRTCVDPLRQRRVKADRDRDLARQLPSPTPEHVFIAPVARADDHDLEAQLDQLRHRLLDQVETLDVIEPRDDRAQRLVDLLEPELTTSAKWMPRPSTFTTVSSPGMPSRIKPQPCSPASMSAPKPNTPWADRLWTVSVVAISS